MLALNQGAVKVVYGGLGSCKSKLESKDRELQALMEKRDSGNTRWKELRKNFV